MKKDKKKFTLGQKLWGHFILTRPQQLIWLDVFMAISVYGIVARHFPTIHFSIFILCSIISDAGACTLNDLGDLKSDSKSTEPSRKLRPLVTGLVSKRAAKNQAIILYSIGLVIAFYLELLIFFAALLLVLLSIQYSLRPLKMDGRPIVSQLFWVAFGLIYYLAVTVYLVKYENVPMKNVYNGIYFLLTMVVFAGIAETLAKDLRDLENDRVGGKNTTPVYFGVKPAVIGAFVFSITGLIFWAIPYFTAYDTNIILQLLIVSIVILWNALCFLLCRSLFKMYSKKHARKLHKGFILTFTIVLSISFLAGIT